RSSGSDGWAKWGRPIASSPTRDRSSPNTCSPGGSGNSMAPGNVPHFQEELDQLKSRLLEMGGLAEDRMSASVRALVDRDHALVEKVLAGDTPINQLHIEIDGRCVRLLALHQPMAVDRRMILSAVKLKTGLERV